MADQEGQGDQGQVQGQGQGQGDQVQGQGDQGQGHGDQGQGEAPPKEEDKPTSSGHYSDTHFVSGLIECETKTVTWEINKVSELFGMSEEEQNDKGITFNAGHSIGIRATWNLCVLSDDKVLMIGFKLSSKSEAKLVNAGHSITLSSGGEVLATYKLGPKEFNKPNDDDEHEEEDFFGLFMFSKSSILQKTDGGNKPLRVTLRVKVFSNKGPLAIKKVPKAKLLNKEDLNSDLQKLLESEDGADVDIRVPLEIGGEVGPSSYTKRVHKGILMARSSVFSKMFAKENAMVEATTGEVVIKDLSPKGLDIFLHYLYTGKVLQDWVKIPQEIISIAEQYDLGRLKKYCGRNIKAAVTTSNVFALYKVVKLHKLSFAKRAIEEFTRDNAKSVLNDGEEEDTSDSDDSEEDAGEEEVDDGSEFA